MELSPDKPETLRLHPVSYLEPLDLRGAFLRTAPVEIELGAGDGSFLIQWAKLNSSTNFLGVEDRKSVV